MNLARRTRRAARSAILTAELFSFVASPRRRRDPYPAYRRLRRLEPIHHSPLGVWVLSGYAPVRAALREPSLSSSIAHLDPSTLRLGLLRRLLGDSALDETGPYFEMAPKMFLFRDPPDHTRLRRLVSAAFTPAAVRDLEDRMAAIAHRLLDAIEPTGTAELMGGFAYPYPARVICELLGVPPHDARLVFEHAPALAAGLDPGPLLGPAAQLAANHAAEALVDYLTPLITHRRAHPRDDLLSRLTLATDAVHGDDELIATVVLLLIAGHETTANLIGNSVVALLGQPAAAEQLHADSSLDASAVDELVRFDSPVQMTMRVATRPLDVTGVRIDPGSVLVLCLGAANRDPDAFDSPERLDWNRSTNHHVAFGGGIHHCLGASLARAEARIALRALFDRLPALALAAEPVRRDSYAVRGLSALPLTWRPSCHSTAIPNRTPRV